MTGADGTYDYKAMAAGIVLAGGEGMGNLLPVVEKELLHYRILDAMMREGFFSSLVFQGGIIARGTPDELKGKAPGAEKNGGAADMTLEEAFIAYIEEVQRKGGHA